MAALTTCLLLCLKYESETDRERHKELLVFRKLHPKKSISVELINAK